jgi:hypothetical protein
MPALLSCSILAVSIVGLAQTPKSPRERAYPLDAIWREPFDIRSRDLFYGPGGKERQPRGRLEFVKEDLDGSKAKFVVVDEDGVRWKIKLGEEAQPEVAATRLIWAVGYFVDENYYRPTVTVEKLPHLERGQKHVSAGGVVHGVRIERSEHKKLGDWDWFDNPYIGTKELNGLRVMMALVNNWDLGRENNSIRHVANTAEAYYVGDLGSSFGQSLHGAIPTRNDIEGYERAAFVHRVGLGAVDFSLRTCPGFFAVVYTPYFLNCRQNERVVRDIPRPDVKWIGGFLQQLSRQQITDAFRAAGYPPELVSDYVQAVSARIAQLKNL